jgi:hypothetical protein
MIRRWSRVIAAGIGLAVPAMLSQPSLALDLPTPFKYDMGPFGSWTVNGGVEAAASGWNNAVPRDAANGCSAGSNCMVPGVGGGTTGDLDLTNAIAIINSHGNMFGDSLPLQFHAWVGEPPQTPVIGYTSPNVAPNLYSTEGKGLNGTGHASFLFKGWATFQPLSWFSIEGGRLPSVDGTEIGVGFLNALPFLSDLNNMQTTVADGVQINFMTPGDNAFYGVLPGYGSTLTIRLADGYKTGRVNELGFLGLWNLTPDASDFIALYGHTRLGVAGNGADITGGPGSSDDVNSAAVGGFGMWNSDLIGAGVVYNLTRRLLLNAEIETQWLPESAIPQSVRGTFAGKSQNYYRWSTQWTLAYDFGIKQMLGMPIRFGWAVQPSFTYQHANTSDPNANSLGNYLGIDALAGSTINQGGNTGIYGTFGAGSKMYALQTGPSFQFHNAFVRPTVAWTHLASIDNGFGYGNRGLDHDQFVVMLDFGFLLGQQEDTDTGQH